MTDPANRRLARQIRRLSRDNRAMARASQAGFRSVEVTDGPVQYYDEDGTPRMQAGVSDDGTFTIVENNTTPPPTPTDPDVFEAVGGVEIVYDGTFVDANTPTDFAYVEVHALDTPETVPDDSTQIHAFSSVNGGNFFYPMLSSAPGKWFGLVAVNRSGVESSISALVFKTAGRVLAETDGAVPEAVSTLMGIPGPGMIFLRWSPALNNDDVEYVIYGSPTSGFTLDDSLVLGRVKGTAFTVRELSAAVAEEARALRYDVDYYYRVLATDADGPATLPSPELGIRPVQVSGDDIAARSIIGEHMVAGTFTGDVFEGNLILATTISTGSQDETTGELIGRRVDISPDGIRLFDSNGEPLAVMPTGTDETPYYKGRFEMETARVLDGLTIESLNNEILAGASFTIGAGVNAPKIAPLLQVEYTNFQLDVTTKASARPGSVWDHGLFALNPSQITTFAYHPLAGKWMVAQNRGGNLRVWFFNGDGTIATVPAGQPGAGEYWVDDYLNWSDITGLWASTTDQFQYGVFGRQGFGWRVFARCPDGQWRTNALPSLINDEGQRPFATLDTNGSTIAVFENDNTSPPFQLQHDNLVLRRFSMINTNFGTLSLTSTRTFGYGSARTVELAGAAINAFDLGAGIKVATAPRGRAGGLITIGADANGVNSDPNYNFPLNGPVTAMTWADGNFWSVNSSGLVNKYSSWHWEDTNNKVYVAFTWYDSDTGGSGTHETPMGKVASIDMPKRAKLKVTLPQVPDKGGVDDPDSWRLYAAQGATNPGTATYKRQATGGASDRSTSWTIVNIQNGSTLTAVPFPNTSPAVIQSEITDANSRRQFSVDGAGQGRWPWIQPIGGVGLWPSALPTPAGWLKTTGQTVSTTTYAELSALYGTTFNTGGEAAGTFRLPDVAVGPLVGIVKY